MGPEHLQPNRFVDCDHPAVLAYAHEYQKATPTESAIALYYAVRDGFRYNPWRVRFEPRDYAASSVLERDPAEGAHCIDKALVLAATCRALGIPSRLHFANVRNHIGTAKLEDELGTDLLVFHGYTELFLNECWVAATPAFNKGLCDHLGVAPLEFDGKTDSIFQEFEANGARFMEYVHDHGVFPGVPMEQMLAAWKQHYSSVREGRWPEPVR